MSEEIKVKEEKVIKKPVKKVKKVKAEKPRVGQNGPGKYRRAF
jgi:hypothetical protein